MVEPKNGVSCWNGMLLEIRRSCNGTRRLTKKCRLVEPEGMEKRQSLPQIIEAGTGNAGGWIGVQSCFLWLLDLGDGWLGLGKKRFI